MCTIDNLTFGFADDCLHLLQISQASMSSAKILNICVSFIAASDSEFFDMMHD